jgi:hypothetical protein
MCSSIGINPPVSHSITPRIKFAQEKSRILTILGIVIRALLSLNLSNNRPAQRLKPGENPAIDYNWVTDLTGIIQLSQAASMNQ